MISNEFRRFYHGMVLSDFYEQMLHVKKPKRPISMDTFKQALKEVDPDYPKDKHGKPISTEKVLPKELVKHIEFIRLVAANNGITLAIDDEEWARIMARAEA